MAFQSFSYFIFLLTVLVLYYLLPTRLRWQLLLVGSYFFYMCWNAGYALLMLFSTIVTFASGLLIDRANQEADETTRLRRKKLWVAVSILLNLAILFFFKYGNMFFSSLRALTDALGLSVTWPRVDFLLPIGISFYIFQGLGYTVDVYRGDIPATRHFGKYALFVSFFPQLIAGPIERPSALLNQFDEIHRPDFDMMRRGALLLLTGLVKKLLIADRLAVLVNLVYENLGEYSAPAYIVATVCFAFQIYCDFSGYSNMAVGSAALLGFRLTQNFNRPYFATSIGYFWRKWHISLSSWFRDYVYIPLGGSRVALSRWVFNNMVVFLISGLWHGADWTFVLWGAINGAYIVFGQLLKPLRERALAGLHIRADGGLRRLLATVVTFVLTCFAWMFFRANTFADLQQLLARFFTQWDFASVSKLVYLVNGRECLIMAISVLALCVLEFFDPKHRWQDRLFASPLPLRWAVYLVLLFALILFGEYSDSASFIYFQF